MVWRFDILALDSVRSIAGAEVQEADVLIVAAQRQTNPRAALATWLEQWAAQGKSEPGALVGLLYARPPADLGSDSPLAKLLGTIAQERGGDLFLQEIRLPPVASDLSRERVQRAATQRPTVLQKAMDHPAYRRHWGLNE
jgi:hypothetical protein